MPSTSAATEMSLPVGVRLLRAAGQQAQAIKAPRRSHCEPRVAGGRVARAGSHP
jgi:hypothetical protein